MLKVWRALHESLFIFCFDNSFPMLPQHRIPRRPKHLEKGARTIKIAQVVFFIMFAFLLYQLSRVKGDFGSSGTSTVATTRVGSSAAAHNTHTRSGICTHTITDNEEDGLFTNLLGVLSALSIYGPDIHVRWSNPRYLAPGR